MAQIQYSIQNYTDLRDEVAVNALPKNLKIDVKNYFDSS